MQAAGSRQDHTCVQSPVVISSYVSQLELDCIGRHMTLYVLFVRVILCVSFIFLQTSFFMTWRCFLADGGAGNYDIVNNTVVSTPGPQNHRTQNVSLRQSWEMNYQEAAIYLQVTTS